MTTTNIWVATFYRLRGYAVRVKPDRAGRVVFEVDGPPELVAAYWQSELAKFVTAFKALHAEMEAALSRDGGRDGRHQ